MADLSTPRAPRLIERSRRLAQDEIAQVALRLFLAQGFDATSVDQIVAEAGVSRRTFFRYFGTKEDVVLRRYVELGPIVADALAARPPDEEPWPALRAALAALQQHEPADAHALAVVRLIMSTPSLRAWHLEKHRVWQELLLPVMSSRLPNTDPTPDISAQAIVGAALACLDAATDAWIASNGALDLAAAFDAASTAVARATAELDR